jgi:hypothetical protein
MSNKATNRQLKIINWYKATLELTEEEIEKIAGDEIAKLSSKKAGELIVTLRKRYF